MIRVMQSHQQCQHLIEHYMTSYSPCTETMSLSCTVFHTQQDICRSCKPVLPQMYLVQPLTWQHWNFIMIFGIRKLESWTTTRHCLCVCNVDITLACDGHTNTQMDRHTAIAYTTLAEPW